MSDLTTEPVGDAAPSSPNGEPPNGPPGMMDRITGVGEGAGRALLVPTLALLLALIVGAVIIMATDVDAWRRMGEDPGGALGDMVTGVWVAYRELFQGAFGSVRAISETLFTASPLILAGLAVAVGFRTGLFNIGARGQMFIGGLFALWVGLHVDLPAYLHIPLALIAAIVGGGLWGGLAGFLKARTGAHEVITTIMLNFIAAFFVLYVLKTSLFQEQGSDLPQSAPILESARLPTLFGAQYRINISFLIAVAAVFFVEWLLFRVDDRLRIPRRRFLAQRQRLCRDERCVSLHHGDVHLRGPRRARRSDHDSGAASLHGDFEFPGDDRLRCDRPRPPGAVTSLRRALVGPSLRGADRRG